MEIEPFQVRAAWEGRTLQQDQSWVVGITQHHRQELIEALEAFKTWASQRRLTAQWLHGNMLPSAENFPLPTLGPLLRQAQHELEESAAEIQQFLRQQLSDYKVPVGIEFVPSLPVGLSGKVQRPAALPAA